MDSENEVYENLFPFDDECHYNQSPPFDLVSAESLEQYSEVNLMDSVSMIYERYPGEKFEVAPLRQVSKSNSQAPC